MLIRLPIFSVSSIGLLRNETVSPIYLQDDNRLLYRTGYIKKKKKKKKNF